MTIATISFRRKRVSLHPETEDAREFEKCILELISQNLHDEAANLVSTRSTFYFESMAFDEPCDDYFSMDKDIAIPFTDQSARIRVGRDSGMLIATFDVDFKLTVKEGVTQEEFEAGLEKISAENGAFVDLEGFDQHMDDGGHFYVSSFEL